MLKTNNSACRTKASTIYKATDYPRVIPILLGHSKIEHMVRYLGIDIETALILAEKQRYDYARTPVI